MSSDEENQKTYRRLKPEIDNKYPKGHFIAIDDGRVVADAPSFDGLQQLLDRIRTTRPEFLVVQAGEEYPEYATIFLQ
jgi:hypothetical protein